MVIGPEATIRKEPVEAERFQLEPGSLLDVAGQKSGIQFVSPGQFFQYPGDSGEDPPSRVGEIHLFFEVSEVGLVQLLSLVLEIRTADTGACRQGGE